MDGFNPIYFTITFILLLYCALKNGARTSAEDEDIDDYWSDG